MGLLALMRGVKNTHICRSLEGGCEERYWTLWIPVVMACVDCGILVIGVMISDEYMIGSSERRLEFELFLRRRHLCCMVTKSTLHLTSHFYPFPSILTPILLIGFILSILPMEP